MATPLELLIVPRTKVAGHLLSKSQGALYKTMISIGDPGSRLPAGFRAVSTRLRVEFIDADDPAELLGPSAADVASILAFAPTIARLGGRCLIHCEAGISRSTAAGMIVLRHLHGPGSDARAFEEVRRIVPTASPNRLMLLHADLAMGSRLLEALGGNLPLVADLLGRWTWVPIPGCPGRSVLQGAPPSTTVAEVLGCEVEPRRHRSEQARDEVLVVELADGGLLSYARADGTYAHTLNTLEGLRRKLTQLGLTTPKTLEPVRTVQ